jgi:hypothetical protein
MGLDVVALLSDFPSGLLLIDLLVEDIEEVSGLSWETVGILVDGELNGENS